MSEDMDGTRDISRGAELLYRKLRSQRGRTYGQGQPMVRFAGRSRLARLLRCTVRTVSRYTAELERVGLIRKVPPKRVRTPKGWACLDVQGYILTMISLGPALPHIRRSHRAVIPVSPSPLRGNRPQVGSPPDAYVRLDPASLPPPEVASRGAAACRAALAAARHATA
jgi:hypothetical protein